MIRMKNMEAARFMVRIPNNVCIALTKETIAVSNVTKVWVIPSRNGARYATMNSIMTYRMMIKNSS